MIYLTGNTLLGEGTFFTITLRNAGGTAWESNSDVVH